MEQTRRLTAIIEREDDGFVALCPEVDVASQGSSIEEARANLIEALTLNRLAACREEAGSFTKVDVRDQQAFLTVGLVGE